MAGDHPGSFSEEQLDVGQGFRNGYERSKFEAERLVSRASARLPVQIFRPSIIVGERESGWTASFNVLYPPLKAFQAGAIRRCPPAVHAGGRRAGRLRGRRGVRAGGRAGGERRGPSPGGGAAGDHGRSAGRVGLLLLQATGAADGAPGLYRRLLHPLLLRTTRGRRRRALERTEALFPYFEMKVRFDNRCTKARLRRTGLEAPLVDGYLDRLLDFAVASRWGREPLSRVEAQQRL